MSLVIPYLLRCQSAFQSCKTFTKGGMNGEKSKQTSSKVASKAAKTLQDKSASNISKSLAASALSQSAKGKRTGAGMEDKASKVLSSDKYSDATKELAASVLLQSNKER